MEKIEVEGFEEIDNGRLVRKLVAFKEEENIQKVFHEEIERLGDLVDTYRVIHTNSGSILWIYSSSARQKVETITVYNSPSQLWSYKWIGKPLGYLLSTDEREEWLGDLLEIQNRMIKEDEYPNLVINTVISLKAFLLIFSKIRCLCIELLNING
ncbi:hypothetical protein N836_05035 [Leptolyngbya sp. Heron Island J]|uniref:hypothetical protein n=1 Tax=Leptolyngbya sp. Heron Island J TaxID=1385935 RepID=UPI0003B9D788|nr:hypothetical protein [Leptolyngbya sp. Heron Island J]ESA36927.1 hypothetical protein N836_05035 [Leptolyngbya sp. Heron Island J]